MVLVYHPRRSLKQQVRIFVIIIVKKKRRVLKGRISWPVVVRGEYESLSSRSNAVYDTRGHLAENTGDI